MLHRVLLETESGLLNARGLAFHILPDALEVKQNLGA
jgi:hypothetical protein